MPSPITLRGQRRPVEIAPHLFLEAAPFYGEARPADPDSEPISVLGAGENAEGALLAAMAAHGITSEAVVEVDASVRALATPPDDGPTTPYGEAAQRMVQRHAAPDRDYALLYSDEGGVSRWIFPDRPSSLLPQPHQSVFESNRLSFAIPRDGAPAPDAEREIRSLSWSRARLLRLLSWPKEEAAGLSAYQIAKRWEAAQRPYGLWQLVDGPLGRPAWELRGRRDPAFWEWLAEGPILLLLHGTFSTVQSGYAALLESPQLADLRQRYGQRVIAFNHPTLHPSLRDNAESLLSAIPPQLPLTLDVVAHSRGCLLGRTVAQGEGRLQRPHLTLRKAIWLAGPQRGTRLADHERWKALIDRATNLLSALPSSGYHQALTTILTLVKIIGADAVGALPGLSAMAPQSAALAALNRGQSQGTTYYGIAADYRPTDPNLAALMLRRTGDELRDRFFDEPNDGIVPTAGAFDLRHPHPDFPLPPERRWQSAANSPIQHSQLFATPAIVDQMTRWLRDV